MKAINEKSVSKNQQKFMGMVHGLQKGTINPKDVSADVEKAAASMSKKDATDFASTKHKGLPTRVKNEIVRRLKEYGTIDDRHHAQEPNYENFPQAWLMGRGSSANEPKIYDKDRDYDDTNFRKKNSGQEDIEEHVITEIKAGIFKGKLKINGQLIDVEVELYGADNKTREFLTKIVNVDKKYLSKFPSDGILRIPAIIFRRGGWVRVKTPTVFENTPTKKIDNHEDKNGFVDNATSSTAWLMGREGRKFKAAKYDKEGTYDGENFVSKNSGQPDLEEYLKK